MNITTGAAPWYNSGVALKPYYIVLHYTANNGDTARGNCNYFHGNKVKTGAHFFVDEKEVCSSTPLTRLANHCGGKLQGSGGHTFYGKAKNINSIGIEMCSRKDANGNYYLKEETMQNAAELVKYLMNKYNIPAARVIRHYDVTGKICPAPLVNEAAWQKFKARLGTGSQSGSLGKEVKKMYKTINEIPDYGKEAVKWAQDNKILLGNGSDLGLNEDTLKCLVFMYRALNK